MQGVPLLVLANKQDLINSLPAPEVLSPSSTANLGCCLVRAQRTELLVLVCNADCRWLEPLCHS